MNIFDIEIDIDKSFHDESIFSRNMHEFVIDRFVILENDMIFQVVF